MVWLSLLRAFIKPDSVESSKFYPFPVKKLEHIFPFYYTYIISKFRDESLPIA